MGPKSIVHAVRPVIWLLLVALPVTAGSVGQTRAMPSSHAPAVLAEGTCWTCGH